MPQLRSTGAVGSAIVVRLLRLGLATLILLAGCTNPESSESARRANSVLPDTTRSVEPRGTWRPIAAPPIPPAAGMAGVWTGRQLVVWGGSAAGGAAAGGDGGTWHPAGAGAAYDPATDRWEVLPPAPVTARVGATAVWSGREVLVWGGAAGPDAFFADGAAYDPAARRWRKLPAAPIRPRTGHEAVWTGREMVVWGGYPRCCPIDSVLHDPAAAAFDPATDRWRRIGDVPPPWSGDDGTAVTVAEGDRPLVWRKGRLAAFDPTYSMWSEVPGAHPPGAPADPALPSTTADPFALGTATDGEVFTWTGRSGDLRGLAWRAADATWRRTATLGAQGGGRLTAGGPGRIYAAAGQSTRVLEYRVGEDRWEELPLPPIPTRSYATLVWTGSELLFWGGSGDEGPEMDGASWHCC